MSAQAAESSSDNIRKNCLNVIAASNFSRMSSTKGQEEINEGGAIETKVETVDYRSPAGKDDKATPKEVGVVHLIRADKGRPGNSNPVARAADAVANAFRSAKDAITGIGKGGAK